MRCDGKLFSSHSQNYLCMQKKSANLFNFLIADVKIPIDQSLFFLAVIDLALKEVVNILRLGIAH